MWMYLVILALGSIAVLILIFLRYRSTSFLYDDVDEENDDDEEEEEEGVRGVVVDKDEIIERMTKDESQDWYGGYFA